DVRWLIGATIEMYDAGGVSVVESGVGSGDKGGGDDHRWWE
nr:hypothetical protein [Tanacetum cinerariifolium]